MRPSANASWNFTAPWRGSVSSTSMSTRCLRTKRIVRAICNRRSSKKSRPTRQFHRCGRSRSALIFRYLQLPDAERLCDRPWPQCVEALHRPANQGTGGGTPDRGDHSRPHRHRRRGIARGAPAIRRKSLPALGQRRRASAPSVRRSDRSAATGSRRPYRRLRHRSFHHRVCASDAQRAHPRQSI